MSNTNNRFLYIYEITNNINGKTYIGQRHCPINRIPETDEYMGSGIMLCAAKKKYGIENFSKRILAICHTQDILNILEKHYIAVYREVGKAEYNISRGGYMTDDGMKHNSEACKDFWNSERGKEVRKQLSETADKYFRTPSAIENRKKAMNKFWNSERGSYQKEINSEIQKNREDAWTKGKHWYNDGVKNVCAKECPEGFVPGRLGDFTCTEEMKEKKRQAMRNMSPEKKAEMSKHLSEARKGKKLSESCKENIGNANRGRKYFNNGEIEVMRFECPEGFVSGRCPKAKAAISNGMK